MLPVSSGSSFARGIAGDIVHVSLAPVSLNNFIISSSGLALCSIVSTPPFSATLTPSGLYTCAATLSPSLWASSQQALTYS